MAVVPTTERQFYDVEGKVNTAGALLKGVAPGVIAAGEAMDAYNEVKITAQLSTAKQRIKMKEMELRNVYENDPENPNYQKDYDDFTKSVYGELREKINPIYRMRFDRKTEDLNKVLKFGNEQWQFKQMGENMAHDIKNIADNMMDDGYESGAAFDYQTATANFQANMAPIANASSKYLGSEKVGEALREAKENYLMSFAEGAMDEDLDRAEAVIKNGNFKNEVGGGNYAKLLRVIKSRKKQREKAARQEARRELARSEKAREKAFKEKSRLEKEQEEKNNQNAFFEKYGEAMDGDDKAFLKYAGRLPNEQERQRKKELGHYDVSTDMPLTRKNMSDYMLDKTGKAFDRDDETVFEHWQDNGVLEGLDSEKVGEILTANRAMQEAEDRNLTEAELNQVIAGETPEAVTKHAGEKWAERLEAEGKAEREQEKELKEAELQDAQDAYRERFGKELKGAALTHYKLYNEIPEKEADDFETKAGRALTKAEKERFEQGGGLPAIETKPASKAENALILRQELVKTPYFTADFNNKVRDWYLSGKITKAENKALIEEGLIREGAEIDSVTKAFVDTYYRAPTEIEQKRMSATSEVPDARFAAYAAAGGTEVNADNDFLDAAIAYETVNPTPEQISAVRRFKNAETVKSDIEAFPVYLDTEKAKEAVEKLITSTDFKTADDYVLMKIFGYIDKQGKDKGGVLEDEAVDAYKDKVLQAKNDDMLGGIYNMIDRNNENLRNEFGELFLLNPYRTQAEFERARDEIYRTEGDWGDSQVKLQLERINKLYRQNAINDPRNEQKYLKAAYRASWMTVYPQLADEAGNPKQIGSIINIGGISYVLQSGIDQKDILLTEK